MLPNKGACQLCAMEKGAQKILDAAKGDVSRAIVSACITGMVGVMACPEVLEGTCIGHKAQVTAAAIQAVGILAEKTMQEAGESIPEPPPQGKDIN